MQERIVSVEIPALPSARSQGAVDENDVTFILPDEGTPAAEALAANANVQTTKLTKYTRKIKKKAKLKNLNIVKRLKKHTKSTRKKHFSKNFKGKVINGTHELYTLTVGMMFGLRCTVGKEEFDEELALDDFNYVEKRNFPPEGQVTEKYKTPAHSLGHTFKFKSYSPKVFKRLRDFYDIDTASYMHSVCGNFNFIEFISNSKSGQFFFYSHDGKYMVKTQTKEENKFMKRILPHYFKYVTENPHSLMVRFLGMHRVKMHHLRRKVHFVIMASVFDTPIKIHKIYDLKGSLHGRIATTKERQTGGVLKDLDLLNDEEKFHMGHKRQDFVKQIERDAMFLADLNIMDYSLLIGIHYRSHRGEDAREAEASWAAGEDIPTRSNTPFREGRVRSLSLGALYPDAERRIEGDPQEIGELLARTVMEDAKETKEGEGGVAREKSTKSSASFREKQPTSITTASGQSSGRSDKDKGMDGGSSKEEAPDSSAMSSSHSTPTRRRPVKSDGGQLAVTKRGSSKRLSAKSESNKTNPLGNSGRSLYQSESSSKRLSGTSGDEDDDDDDDDDDCDDEYDDEYDDEDEEYDEGDDGDSDYEDVCASPRQIFLGIGAPEVQLQLSKKSPGPVIQFLPSKSTKLTKSTRKALSKETVESQRLENVLGMGVVGKEGKTIASIFKAEALVDALSESASQMNDDVGCTYGPGVAPHKPWTGRVDGGINSRVGRHRGDEIYYCGVIDILQQFNAMKRMENTIKGMYQDAKKISCVDSQFYAERFVKFLSENID